MKESPVVSVIVVAYNAGKYLRRCIDSIVSQSLSDFELVFVDDGSTDDTGNIIDGYAQSDKRIIVIHQKNAGVAVARQTGLDKATGQYSIFVDADDWIETDMLESLLDEATKGPYDIVVCDYVEEKGGESYYFKQKPRSHRSEDVLQQMLCELHGSLCNKLVRNELYNKSGVRLVEGINYCEDEYLVICLLSQGCRVGYVNRALYHYDKKTNPNSISNLWSLRPAREYELFISSCVPFLNTPELKRNLDNRTASIIKTLTYSPLERYFENREFYRHHKQALMESNMPFVKKIFCVLYFNGFRFVAVLRNLYQNQFDQ